MEIVAEIISLQEHPNSADEHGVAMFVATSALGERTTRADVTASAGDSSPAPGPLRGPDLM